MREKTNMEFLIQQKMESFRLDPDPADWQAIHDRLHKKKRRRFFWWVFPIAGALIIGGCYFLLQEEAGQKPNSGKNLSLASLDSNNTKLPKVNSTIPIVIAESTLNKTTQTEDEDISAITTSPASSHRSVENQRTENLPRQHDNISQPLAHSETTDIIVEQVSLPEQVDHDLNRSMPGVQKRISLNQDSAIEPKENLPLDNAKKIPNTITHKNQGWYLGVYGGIGIHNAVNPISMAKANDALPNTGSSGSSYYYQGNVYKNTGFHYDAGFILEKKNKNFDLSFGLGIQHNNWSQGSTLYKDSILSTGSLYSRTAVATKASTYQSFALEVPVIAGFRLAGKNNSSFWLNLGLNNAFILSFKEQNELGGTAPIFSSGSTRDSSLTGSANIYQPQFRLGLTYEFAAKKYHWQVSPYMQYGLRNVMQQGEPDVHMLNLGMQFRYFFRRLR